MYDTTRPLAHSQIHSEFATCYDSAATAVPLPLPEASALPPPFRAGLLLPHLTFARATVVSGETATPVAQASAARSALNLSLKFMNAHLSFRSSQHDKREKGERREEADLFFST